MSDQKAIEPKIKFTRQILTVPEAAKYLKISTTKIRDLIHTDEIPFFQIGRRFLLDLADLDAWVDELKNA